MDEEIDIKKLRNFSEGKYSYNDYLKIKRWFLKEKDNEFLETELFNNWKKFSSKKQAGALHYLFEKVQYKILLEENKGRKKKTLWFYYRRVAAVLIPFIFFAGGYYFFRLQNPTYEQSWVEINAPVGARTQFMLPDSTIGWLNNGAKLKYPAVFAKNREVRLSGEAFFHVKHQDQSNFTVQVADMDIRVLGTKFNVAAYSGEPLTQVVLKEGKVELIGKSKAFKRTLSPGEMLAFNSSSNTLYTEKVDPDLFTAWTKGYLVIDNEPLGKASRKIGRWYNADIQIKGDKLKNFRFKATFKEESLEEVLNFIAMTTPISYQVSEKQYDANGVMKKPQIIISLK